MAVKVRIPERFARADLRSVDHDIFDCVHAYANDLAAELKKGRGLFLSGPPGVGKTYAMAALTRAYLKRAANPDHVFETAYTLFERYGTHGAVDPSREGRSWSSIYEETPWLVINDLGKEFHGGAKGEVAIYRVGRLLRTRSEACRVTHVTTNLTLEGSDGNSFLGVYGESTFSLIREMFSLWLVDGPDRRTNPGG